MTEQISFLVSGQPLERAECSVLMDTELLPSHITYAHSLLSYCRGLLTLPATEAQFLKT